jgi:hypothetical protein
MPKKKKTIAQTKGAKKVILPTPLTLVTSLRELFVHHSGCDVQSGWPCGTCLNSVLRDILSPNAIEYQEHNHPVDRINEFWRATLQIRELDPFYQKNQASLACTSQDNKEA